MREKQLLIDKISDQDILTGEIKTKTGTTVIKASVRLEFCDYETTLWSSGTEKEEGDKVIATEDNNHEYSCIGEGETGSIEPIWPTDGGTVPDGDLFWVDLGIYDRESLLENVRFFYHCDPGNIDEGHVAFYIGDMVLVAKVGANHFIIGFADLKPRACDVIVLGGTTPNGKILRSVDSGKTWNDLGQQYGQTNIRGIASLGNSRIALAGTYSGGKILRSIDLGVTWSDLGQQFGETWILDIIDLDSGISLAGTNPNGKILKSIDWGQTWADKGQQYGQSVITELAYAHDGLCLATTYNWNTGLGHEEGKILRSIDYGDTWAVVYSTPSDESWWFESIAYLGNGICIAGTGWSGHIWRSTDYGLSWEDIGGIEGAGYLEAPTYIENGICLIGFHQSYGSYEGHIWRSTDYGLNWTNLGGPSGESWIYELAYIGASICLAGTGDNGKILRSEDKGLTWDNLGTQAGQTGIGSLKRLGKMV